MPFREAVNWPLLREAPVDTGQHDT